MPRSEAIPLAWRRIYEVNRHGKRLFGAIVTIGDSRGLVQRRGLCVSPEGRLDSIEALQVVPSGRPVCQGRLVRGFPWQGRGFSLSRRPGPTAAGPRSISGATESYLITAGSPR